MIDIQLAQPIRLLLEYTGTTYEDKFFSCGEGKIDKNPLLCCHVTFSNRTYGQLLPTHAAPNYDKSCWFDVKPNLGMDFPNVSDDRQHVHDD